MRSIWIRAVLGALGSVAAIGPIVCLAPHASAQTFDRRWGGAIHDAFTNDGQNVWLVEDGGRIRHSFNATSANPTWTFQTTPPHIQNTLRRIFFLADNLTGWAVSEDGYILSTTNGGASWSELHRMPSVITPNAFEDLWDVHFLDANEGWVLGLHGIWYTIFGGIPGTWTQVNLFDPTGQPIVNPSGIELYALDVVPRGSAILGLASAEPSWIFRATDPLNWLVVFDVTSLCPPSGCTVPTPTSLSSCACDLICDAGVDLEPWDIEISRHPTEPLALCVGGATNDCGLILGSYDDGLTWQLERHECFGGGCMTPRTHNPPGCGNGTWHLRKFFELYGVSIFHGDNSAIAGGYKGQHVVRVIPQPPTPPYWRDTTDYNGDPFVTPGAVTMPVFGAATDGGNASTGRGLLTAMGGYIRTTTNGGQSWATTQPPGEPWRIRDVHFTDADHGWMVSQFFRIARTIDAGATWSPDDTQAAFGQAFLNAITFDAPGDLGVAVGDVDPILNRPKIFYNLQASTQTQWSEPSIVYNVFPDEWVATGGLNEVAWASGLEFWAAGTQGQIFYSDPTLGPDVWHQFVPPGQTYSQFAPFVIESVDFAGSGDGLFAGEIAAVGKAYQYLLGTWTEIPVPAAVHVVTDVAIDSNGTTAYAVGREYVTYQGFVMRATRNLPGASFGAFSVVFVVDECAVGDGIRSVPTLSEVEVDAGGNAWVAGECGRVWRLASGGSVWQPIKSQTDSHVRGMSFPAADTGFLACHRPSRTGHCIVRVTP